jgi:hypothetical protein
MIAGDVVSVMILSIVHRHLHPVVSECPDEAANIFAS